MGHSISQLRKCGCFHVSSCICIICIICIMYMFVCTIPTYLLSIHLLRYLDLKQGFQTCPILESNGMDSMDSMASPKPSFSRALTMCLCSRIFTKTRSILYHMLDLVGSCRLLVGLLTVQRSHCCRLFDRAKIITFRTSGAT